MHPTLVPRDPVGRRDPQIAERFKLFHQSGKFFVLRQKRRDKKGDKIRDKMGQNKTECGKVQTLSPIGQVFLTETKGETKKETKKEIKLRQNKTDFGKAPTLSPIGQVFCTETKGETKKRQNETKFRQYKQIAERF